MDDEECGTLTVPQAGRALGLTRHGSYEAVKRGEIHAIRFGRLLRVPKAWLRSKLEPIPVDRIRGGVNGNNGKESRDNG
jgi:excisionase family DNA binding protein